MEVQNILKFNWTKRWSSSLRLFGCSYWGNQYITVNKKVFGAGFDHILFTHKNGISNCYRVTEETNKFGNFLASKVKTNPELLEKWSIDLKKYADNLRILISKQPKLFLNLKLFSELEKAHDLYTPMAVANNTVVDYLSESLITNYARLLESARTYTESVYDELEQFLRSLTKIIADQEGYNQIYINDIFQDEFKRYLKAKVLPARAELKERYNYSGLFFEKGERYILNGDEVAQLEHNNLGYNVSNGRNLNIKIVQGKSASAGRVRGICRIVLHPDRVLKFNKGDILVTGMTRPNFLPLIKLAGAIITDSGGILCHAAIVARELGKPCIISTEIATKILHDGDLVEVDANKGIVRIIK